MSTARAPPKRNDDGIVSSTEQSPEGQKHTTKIKNLPLEVTQIHAAAAATTGLGFCLKGRLQGINFRLKIQAQANHISTPIEAEAQAILLAVLVNSTMQIQTGTIYSDNQELITSLNDSDPVYNAPNWTLRSVMAQIVSNAKFGDCTFKKIDTLHNTVAHNQAKKARQTIVSQTRFICSNSLHGMCPVIDALQSPNRSD